MLSPPFFTVSSTVPFTFLLVYFPITVCKKEAYVKSAHTDFPRLAGAPPPGISSMKLPGIPISLFAIRILIVQI